jgi:hypothetical protein
MRKHLLILAAVLMLAVPTLAGCGGDDDSASSPSGTTAAGEETGTSAGAGGADDNDTTNPTGTDGGAGTPNDPKSAFVEEANDVCTESNKEIQSQIQAFINNSSKGGQLSKSEEEEGLADLINEVVAPGMEEEIEDIRALGLPAGDEQQVEAILAAMQDAVERAQADPKAFGEQAEPFKTPERLAVEYGLGACGGL